MMRARFDSVPGLSEGYQDRIFRTCSLLRMTTPRPVKPRPPIVVLPRPGKRCPSPGDRVSFPPRPPGNAPGIRGGCMNDSQSPRTVWDERFAGDEYVYGKEPNDFLRAFAPRLPPPPARILSLGEGEGRNAVHLARLGYQVTAVDASSVGLAKARRLAAERHVSINTVH